MCNESCSFKYSELWKDRNIIIALLTDSIVLQDSDASLSFEI